MLLTDFDLFGHPVAAPPSFAANQSPVRRRRVVSQEAKRAKLVRHLEQSNNLVLFDELLDYLKAPLLKKVYLPDEFRSDIRTCKILKTDCEDEPFADDVVIPFKPWGDAWVSDGKGHDWSFEGLIFTQVRLLWRSMEELSLSHNEQEKWSALRWFFRPAIWKHYVWDKKLGKSHCFPVHERDDPFSFHNCCIAARVDRDSVLEGIRRNIPAEVVKAVEKVCKFD